MRRRNLNEWQTLVGEINTTNGWREGFDRESVTGQLAQVMLVITELAELVEDLRDGHPIDSVWYTDRKPEGPVSELADAAIRILDIADIYGIDLEEAVHEKLAYNTRRGYRHGGKVV